MEKNSAPRFPARALSRLMWPTSLGSVEPMSKFSSRKRCGVSAWVSITIAESWMARALGLTAEVWVKAGVEVRIRRAQRNMVEDLSVWMGEGMIVYGCGVVGGMIRWGVV